MSFSTCRAKSASYFKCPSKHQSHCQSSSPVSSWSIVAKDSHLKVFQIRFERRQMNILNSNLSRWIARVNRQAYKCKEWYKIGSSNTEACILSVTMNWCSERNWVKRPSLALPFGRIGSGSKQLVLVEFLKITLWKKNTVSFVKVTCQG